MTRDKGCRWLWDPALVSMGGINRETVHVNNQPIMFWSHLEGDEGGGRPSWSYLFHFSLLSAANHLTEKSPLDFTKYITYNHGLFGFF